MSVILLVRHGQASFAGDDYDRLTPLGEEQARVLGASLRARGTPVDVAVTGTRQRHRRTAALCLESLGRDVPLAVDPAFDEFDHGEVLARFDPRHADPAVLRADVAAAPDPMKAFDAIFQAACARWTTAGADGGYSESYDAFRARCRDGLDRLAASLGRSATALAFTSGGPVAVLAGDLLGVPPQAALDLRFGLVNAGVTKVLATGRGLRLASFNEQAHLEHDNRRLLTWR